MDTRIEKARKILQIMDVMIKMFEAYILAKKKLKRRWWVRPVNLSRGVQGFQIFYFAQLKSKEHFFKATRMSVEHFNTLLTLLSNKLQRHSIRKPIDAESRLGLTLMYLSQGCSPQFLAWAYKMGVSTVRQIIYETCEAIWTELHTVYVAQPNAMEFKTISERFYRGTGMPHCLGAIDGKHINIVCPRRSGSLYYNYKKTFSIVLLAVCDADYCFSLVDVGALGSQSDGGIFARSRFGRMVLRDQLITPPDDNLPGTNMMAPYFFVGDAAFPLKNKIMRPYPGRNLSPIKSNFNKRLSSARVRIENSFGILVNRWRILNHPIYACPKNVDKIVLATIVLHNFLMLNKCAYYFTEEQVDHEENGVLVPGTWRASATPLRSCSSMQANRSSAEAFRTRDDLANYLFQN